MKLISMNKRAGSGPEWIGGRIRTSLQVIEDGGFTPDMLVWIELPSGQIVGTEMINPKRPESDLGTLLVRTMEHPLEGSPRKPASIRVRTSQQAREVRESVGDSIPIRVGPTPEVVEAQASFEEYLDQEDDGPSTYLGDGNLSEPLVAELFRAARAMAYVRPWEQIGDHLLRLDIPAIGVDGACISFIQGDEGETGLLVFPSLEACLAFGETLPEDESLPEPGDGLDFGSEWIGLTYLSPEETPPPLLEEARDQGWDLPDPFQFPVVQNIGRDGLPLPLTDIEIRIATVCAAGTAALVHHKGAAFEGMSAESATPIETSFKDLLGAEVFLAGPYDEFDLHAPAEMTYVEGTEERPSGFGSPVIGRSHEGQREFEPRAGRNEPCPCGSGKKYKKCCLDLDRGASESEGSLARDLRLMEEMNAFAFFELGVNWFDVTDDFVDGKESIALSVPWSHYVAPVNGRPVVEWFLESGRVQDPDDLRHLEAEREAWVSIWEVLEVEATQWILMKDVLTETIHKVTEATASCTVKPGMHVLARVTEIDGRSELSGIHPHSLLPSVIEQVVRKMRRRLRRKTAVPPERLRDYKFARYLLRTWEEAVADGGAM